MSLSSLHIWFKMLYNIEWSYVLFGEEMFKIRRGEI
jgi:hypothetical protein